MVVQNTSVVHDYELSESNAVINLGLSFNDPKVICKDVNYVNKFVLVSLVPVVADTNIHDKRNL